jgi:hypothetical protein
MELNTYGIQGSYLLRGLNKCSRYISSILIFCVKKFPKSIKQFVDEQTRLFLWFFFDRESIKVGHAEEKHLELEM